jgi:methanogenic corrinoid protein MtbC1
MVKAVTPNEVAQLKGELFPPHVLQAFNELIATEFTDRSRTVTIFQEDIIQRIAERMFPEMEQMEPEQKEGVVNTVKSDIFKNGWLNVEEVYRAAGWNVNYTKPAYNETGRAYFSFKAS